MPLRHSYDASARQQRCVSKAAAQNEAHDTVAALIENYFEVGQPYDDCREENHPTKDECAKCKRLALALRAVRADLLAKRTTQ